ncbi:MAG: deaminase [Candidatus Woesearchaeota archaeon]
MSEIFLSQNPIDGSLLHSAYDYANMRSDDNRTRVGALILLNAEKQKGFTPIILGSNIYKGLSSQDLSVVKNYINNFKDWKNEVITHAERDALDTAREFGYSLKDSTMYVTDVPCTNCTDNIMESDISEIISHFDVFKVKPESKVSKDLENIDRLLKAGKSFGFYKGVIGHTKALYDNIAWNP